jgi:UDP-3-O-[3-hydroxymyristoyl] glucosamine N-acyltransferase
LTATATRSKQKGPTAPFFNENNHMSGHNFFQIKPHTLGEIAEAIGVKLPDEIAAGNIISQASPIDDAAPGSLSFIDNRRYAKHLPETSAAAVICNQQLAEKMPEDCVPLIHPQPYKAYAKALSLIYPTAGRPEPITGEQGVSGKAFVGKNVLLENDVIIEAGAVIGANAAIGKEARILANAVIGPNVQIGRNCVIGPGASITHAYLGNDVIVHAGVRIGQDGFGFAMGPGGHDKVPQIGRVIIQDKVEIGANSTIDRGSNRDTVIGEGTKIDNLVQIGHNVVIGRHCVIVGLAGVAGSATLGDYVVIAGQAGIVGHITVHDGAQVGGGAGVHVDVKPGEKVIGYPSMPVRDWMKMNMKLKAWISGKGDKGRES